MTPELLSLVELAKQIGGRAWLLVVRQMYLEGAITCLFFGALIIYCAFLLKQVKQDDADKTEYRGGTVVLTLALSAVIGASIVTIVFGGITYLINPEYYALMRLLGK